MTPLALIPLRLPAPQQVNPMGFTLCYAGPWIYIAYGMGVIRAHAYSGAIEAFGLGGGGYYPMHPGPWVFHQAGDGWQCVDAIAANGHWLASVTRSAAFQHPVTHQRVQGLTILDVSAAKMRWVGTANFYPQSTCVGLDGNYAKARALADGGKWRIYAAGRVKDTTFRVDLPTGLKCWPVYQDSILNYTYTWNAAAMAFVRSGP